jgi:hypothetical protein
MTLTNPSFEAGWTDVAAGATKNQQPTGWALYWLDPGDALLSADTYDGPDDAPVQLVARTIPECVHKHKDQLPPEEQPGGSDPLILDGEYVYKIFSNYNPFGGGLSQTIEIHGPVTVSYRVNVRMHHHGDGSPGAGVWRVTIGGSAGDWNTFGNGAVDRAWTTERGSLDWDGGPLEFAIQVESRAEAGIDFFIDGLDLTIEDPSPDPEPGWYDARAIVCDFDIVRDPARRQEIYAEAAERGVMVGPSHDHVRAWPPGARSYTVELVDIPEARRSEFEDYYHDRSPEIVVEFVGDGEDPGPEPEPGPDWTPRNFVPTGTKLGWHAIGDAGQSDLFAALADHGATPPTVKFVADPGPALLVKDTAPGTWVVGRYIDGESGNYEWYRPDMPVEWQAQQRMQQLMPLWEFHRHSIDYWEIVNEQDPEGAEGHARMAEFFIRTMDIAEANGYKLALFSYSTGVPEPHEWDAIAATGVFERAAAGGHALSLHEYGTYPPDMGAHLCRYRDLYERHILPRKLDIPLYITEYAAWIHLLDQGTDWLWSQLVEYDRQVRQDPYMAGVHIYSVGPGPWHYHDAYVPMYDRFMRYCIEERNKPNG